MHSIDHDHDRGCKITLGPAGPPRQSGVLVVPQSAHVFLILHSSDETPSSLLLPLLFAPSDSNPCDKTKHNRSAKIGMIGSKQNPYPTQTKHDHSLCHLDPSFLECFSRN